jgi:hypothetical protein
MILSKQSVGEDMAKLIDIECIFGLRASIELKIYKNFCKHIKGSNQLLKYVNNNFCKKINKLCNGGQWYIF